MPAMVEKWRKLPVEIEAVEFTQYNGFAICEWADNTYFVPRGYEHSLRYKNEYDTGNSHVLDDYRAPQFLVIRTLEGPHRADIGDFIIKGLAGEFYPCKPDIFKESYEKVEVSDAEQTN